MKNKILIAILILFVAVVLWFIFTTNYPIALVNLQPISAIDFNKNYASSLVYYKNALETYNNKDAKALEADEIKKKLKSFIGKYD